MELNIYLLQIVSGLTEGMIVFLCAMGMTLILGSLKVLNVTHGSIYMIGAFIMATIDQALLGIEGHFYISLFLTTLITGGIGGIVERLIIRPVYNLHHIYQFLTTFGATFIFMDAVKLIWGGQYRLVNCPPYLQGPIELFGIFLPKYNLALILFGIFVYAMFYLFMEKSHYGLIIRAITVDRVMMRLLGTNVSLTYTIIFMIGCGLAGLGGAVIAPLSAAAPGMDFMVLILAFIVIVVGGSGSLNGCVLASILLGLTNAFGVLFWPKVAVGFPFFLMLIVLIFRPWGLFGKPIRMER